MAEAIMNLVLQVEHLASSKEDQETLCWARLGALDLIENAGKILDEVV